MKYFLIFVIFFVSIICFGNEICSKQIIDTLQLFSEKDKITLINSIKQFENNTNYKIFIYSIKNYQKKIIKQKFLKFKSQNKKIIIIFLIRNKNNKIYFNFVLTEKIKKLDIENFQKNINFLFKLNQWKNGCNYFILKLNYKMNKMNSDELIYLEKFIKSLKLNLFFRIILNLIFICIFLCIIKILLNEIFLFQK